MNEGKLKTAVLGLNESGRLLAEAASRADYFQIQAVADRDINLAEKVALEYKCAAYDDYRQLVIQNQLDCLLVAAATHTCDEHIRMAMKKKFHILKLAPPARNFEEAAEFVRLAEEEHIKFAIANPYRFADSFRAFRQFLQQGGIEQVFLVTVLCNVGNALVASWQTDPKLAGGGVLLQDCYQIIDQLMWNFPIPQQIYGVNTSQAADKQQRLYLTEDTTLVTMRFTDTLTGNLIAFRKPGVTGPGQEVLKVYGKDRILTVTASQFTVSDGVGRIIEEIKCDDDELSCLTELLKSFALSMLQPGEYKLYSSGRENLKDMAVIEAAYLSARTSMPEEPVRILQMVQLESRTI